MDGLPPLSTEDWLDTKLHFDEKLESAWAHEVDINVEWRRLRPKILTQVWMLHVKDETDVDKLIVKKTEFSYAMAIMDRIGGWSQHGRNEAGNQIGVSLAAIMWIYTKTVICNGQQHMDVFRNPKRYSVMEAINGVCAQVQENHELISEFSLVMQESNMLEALNCGLEVLCIVQWRCCGALRQPASTTIC